MAKEETKIQEKDGSYIVPKEVFDGLIARVTNLEKGTVVLKPKRAMDHEAIVRFYKGKPVIKYSNVREEKEEHTGKNIAWFDIYLLDEEKPHKVEYLKFLNEANGVKVKILKQENIGNGKRRIYAVVGD